MFNTNNAVYYYNIKKYIILLRVSKFYIPVYTYCIYMVKRRVNRDKQNRTLIFLPAAIRDKFNLQNGGSVDIETDGNRIIITPLEA